ncbi:transposase [Vibrio crassostreae]|uniref:Transposase n=2 Tax=Vibrio TaxID=662 RepID=A0A822MVG6_9VIBR|nr:MULTISPECIES: transposase [Vibrio]MDH5923686.1 hypothetical protein [Vibrio splendidus]MDH5939092.1 hypothetical protein [Vibrio splendidus]MDH5953162.1 hypothetical protein [Vibrio crassostreae]TCL18166.1 hypothetical protein EDB52_1289 [Vibrio crassostreae]TCN02721.1 hypothetical protein EDB35_13721 [Vibrio crassostreae]
MGTIIRVGVDLAKNVFHLHVIDENEKTNWQGKYARNTWLKTIMKRMPFTAIIGMEACGSSHYWARAYQSGVYKEACCSSICKALCQNE